MEVGRYMTGVSTPIIRIILGDSKWLQQVFELQKDLILTTAKYIYQDLSDEKSHREDTEMVEDRSSRACGAISI
jgi:hypothetical protein